jgi:hypothetical protein
MEKLLFWGGPAEQFHSFFCDIRIEEILMPVGVPRGFRTLRPKMLQIGMRILKLPGRSLELGFSY